MSTQPAVINIMVKAVEKAARSLVRDFGEVENLQVSRKGPSDFVSAADLRSEQIIFDELSKAKPNIGFLMEERGTAGPDDASSRWIVDPLDGTSNFIHGIPHWCISIALEENGEITAGVIYDPAKDELFWAAKGSGAFMRNRRLRVSGRNDLTASMIASGFPAMARGDHDQFWKEASVMMKNTAGVRRMGAAALDMAYVAAGRFEGFWERNLGAWDVAAGIIIVKEAGGYVSTLNHKHDLLSGKSILASNSEIHHDLKQLLMKSSKSEAA